MNNLACFTESLREDLNAWQEATARPPLNKHASQVAGIVSQITAAVDCLHQETGGQRQQEIEQAIGDYLHIWDFFRSKFALRYVPWYQPLLGAADDLAWAAFRPVKDAAFERRRHDLREPPLVYFSRDVVPFTVTRGQNYQSLLPRGGLWTERSEAVANNLIVPVVSLPWQRFSSLSVILSVAHEVGHVVVSDLDLLPELRERLGQAKLSATHRPLWSAWLEETFADIFSAVACGAAMALSLVNQLEPQPPPAGLTGELGSGPYPPAELRARMILHVAERRSELGNQPRPPAREDRFAGFAADVEVVAAALLDDEFEQIRGRLEDLYEPVDGAALRDDIGRLTEGRDPQARDIRILLAAATAVELASPVDYAEHHADQLTLRQAGRIRDVTARGLDDGQAHVLQRNRQAGRELAALLTRTASS